MALGSGLVDYGVRRALIFPAFFTFYLAEQLAYGAAVSWGSVRQEFLGSHRTLYSARA
jgi:hypothetical protein